MPPGSILSPLQRKQRLNPGGGSPGSFGTCGVISPELIAASVSRAPAGIAVAPARAMEQPERRSDSAGSRPVGLRLLSNTQLSDSRPGSALTSPGAGCVTAPQQCLWGDIPGTLKMAGAGMQFNHRTR
jgi:hypothetical protein